MTKKKPHLAGKITHIQGKRYMWLLDEHGVLKLHKLDDRGDKDTRSAAPSITPPNSLPLELTQEEFDRLSAEEKK